MSRLAAIALLCVAFGSWIGVSAVRAQPPDPAQAARDERWSLRLLQAKARIDRARERLDEANGAWARAFAKGRPTRVVRESLDRARQQAEHELALAEAELPIVLQAARADGVSPEVLGPYRFEPTPAEPG